MCTPQIGSQPSDVPPPRMCHRMFGSSRKRSLFLSFSSQTDLWLQDPTARWIAAPAHLRATVALTFRVGERIRVAPTRMGTTARLRRSKCWSGESVGDLNCCGAFDRSGKGRQQHVEEGGHANASIGWRRGECTRHRRSVDMRSRGWRTAPTMPRRASTWTKWTAANPMRRLIDSPDSSTITACATWVRIKLPPEDASPHATYFV